MRKWYPLKDTGKGYSVNDRGQVEECPVVGRGELATSQAAVSSDQRVAKLYYAKAFYHKERGYNQW